MRFRRYFDVAISLDADVNLMKRVINIVEIIYLHSNRIDLNLDFAVTCFLDLVAIINVYLHKMWLSTIQFDSYYCRYVGFIVFPRKRLSMTGFRLLMRMTGKTLNLSEIHLFYHFTSWSDIETFNSFQTLKQFIFLIRIANVIFLTF